MKKLTDKFHPIVDIKISRYANQIRKFPHYHYPIDSKEGRKLFNIYLRLLEIESKVPEEAIERHTALCSEVLSKLPRFI